MNSPKNTLEFIVKNILPESEGVNIDSRQENNITILEINAPEELKGRIIGKGGKIIKAIRTIISISFPEQRTLVKVTD